MSLETSGLKFVAKRVLDGKTSPVELVKYVDKVYGDGDGLLEFPEVVNTVETVGGEVIDKIESVVEVGAKVISSIGEAIGDLFL